ncbi:MAG: radical SAM protein, partial [Prevotellaceae bacterium]|nr:radical SAM protein [Prevotellaceae bacterium]
MTTAPPPARPTFTVVNLCCKLNYAEASTIARQLAEGGLAQAAEGQPADVYVVHTCAVTQQAEKKCRQAIRQLAKQGGGAALVCVTGCMASLKAFALEAMPEVALVADKGEVARRIAERLRLPPPAAPAAPADGFFAACSWGGDRTRAFLKVQDGCDYRCAYCTVPAARGASRSAPIAAIAAQAEAAAAQGVREVVLTGVNTGDFGRPAGESLLQLAQRLEQVKGVARYRI